MIPLRPRLRPVDAQTAEIDGQQVVLLRDPFDITDAVLVLPLAAGLVLNYCDGTRTVEDVAAVLQRMYAIRVAPDQIRELLDGLDQHTFLDSPRYHEARERVEAEFAEAPTRRASLAGRSYAAEPAELRESLTHLFVHEDGPGALPSLNGTSGTLTGAIVPHIDFRRGAPTYGHGYRAVADHANADIFVILGTGHGGLANLYAATWKAFETPLGTVPTDTAFLDTLQAHVPFDLCADEFAHRSEHSIEFQAVLLQYLYAERRAIRIVPVLCGSFQAFVESGAEPITAPGVEGFVAGLRAGIADAEARGMRVCLIASADLAHVGPKFGDAVPADDAFRAAVDAADRRMLETVVAGDARGFFHSIHAVRDERRVCGFPSIYTLLAALRPEYGELLQYRQWPDPDDCVTFASVAFYSQPPGT